AGDSAVLDADVRLDDAEQGIDDHRADDDGVQLARTRHARLRHAEADVLRIAPDRLVADRLPILVDANPEVRVAEPDPIAGGGSEAGAMLGGGEAIHASVSPPPPHRTSVTVRTSPGPQRSDDPASMSRRKPSAAPRSN